EGSAIRFELVDGKMALGNIRHIDSSDGDVIYVSGRLSQPESGRFFFQRQTMPGLAGDFVGVIELTASQTAYRIEPTGPDGASELVERPLGSVICRNFPRSLRSSKKQVEESPLVNPDDFPNLPIPDYQKGVILLESLPGAVP